MPFGTPNISRGEYDKAVEYVEMIDEAVLHLRQCGQNYLASKMLDCEIYQKNLERTEYNIRKEKKDKVPEARVPCLYCNTMVLKRGMKEHEGNKKCLAIQAENRQCAVSLTNQLHKKVLVCGESKNPFDYQPDEKGVVVPAGMAVKDWKFGTGELGTKKKAEYDAFREAKKAEIKAREDAKKALKPVPIAPEPVPVPPPIVAETADIPVKKIIKIKPKPVKKKLTIVE